MAEPINILEQWVRFTLTPAGKAHLPKGEGNDLRFLKKCPEPDTYAATLYDLIGFFGQKMVPRYKPEGPIKAEDNLFRGNEIELIDKPK